MTKVQFATPRGVELCGTLSVPEGATDAAVIFSHSFFCARTSCTDFPTMARFYRDLGYATFIFDYSGHGSSGDDIVTTAKRTEDFRAASSWLARQGFTRQLAHASTSGAISALRAHPPAVKSYVIVSGALGGVTYDWDAIFAPEQLDGLDSRGYFEVPDDSPGPRSNFVLTSQTLIDLSLIRPEELLADVEAPLLLMYDRADERAGLVTTAMDAFPLLPPGSLVEVLEDVDLSRGMGHPAADMAAQWAQRKLSSSVNA